MKATFSGKESALQLLIQNGAGPSLKDNDGFSLLHKATKGGNTSIINKLLSLGLDVDSRSSTGVTPLITAALGGKKGAFELLLQRGADPSLKDMTVMASVSSTLLQRVEICSLSTGCITWSSKDL